MTQTKEANTTSCSSPGGSGIPPSVHITLDVPDCSHLLPNHKCGLIMHIGTPCVLYDIRVMDCYFAN
jgi:hypothetical protein